MTYRAFHAEVFRNLLDDLEELFTELLLDRTGRLALERIHERSSRSDVGRRRDHEREALGDGGKGRQDPHAGPLRKVSEAVG